MKPTRKTVRDWIFARNLKTTAVADYVGLSLQTFIQKMKSPLDFSLRQYFLLCKILNVDWDQIDLLELPNPNKKSISPYIKEFSALLREKLVKS